MYFSIEHKKQKAVCWCVATQLAELPSDLILESDNTNFASKQLSCIVGQAQQAPSSGERAGFVQTIQIFAGTVRERACPVICTHHYEVTDYAQKWEIYDAICILYFTGMYMIRVAHIAKKNIK